MLVREGHRLGVRHMLITHAATFLNIAQMQEATTQGAFIEWIRSSLPLTPGVTAKFTAAEEVEALRTVGVQYCVLATDFGQPANLPPPDGFAEYIAALAAAGMTEKELATMTKDNPAKLLGLRTP